MGPAGGGWKRFETGHHGQQCGIASHRHIKVFDNAIAMQIGIEGGGSPRHGAVAQKFGIELAVGEQHVGDCGCGGICEGDRCCGSE